MSTDRYMQTFFWKYTSGWWRKQERERKGKQSLLQQHLGSRQRHRWWWPARLRPKSTNGSNPESFHMFGAQVGGIGHYRGASAITTQQGSLLNSSTPRGSDHQCQLSQLPEEAEDAEDSSIRASQHRMWFAAHLAENDYSFLQGCEGAMLISYPNLQNIEQCYLYSNLYDKSEKIWQYEMAIIESRPEDQKLHMPRLAWCVASSGVSLPWNLRYFEEGLRQRQGSCHSVGKQDEDSRHTQL